MIDQHSPVSGVEFFGVRHHSPAAARLVVERIHQKPPAAVLVEGPSDANHLMDDLLLDHTLPIMVYTWAPSVPDAAPDTPAWRERRSAYYPLCEYSPEWTALRAARAVGSEVAFIDLPWRATLGLQDAESLRENRYAADSSLQAVGPVLEKWGVDSLDLVFDELLEMDPELTADQHQERLSLLSDVLRPSSCDPVTWARETFMAEQIRAACARYATEPARPVLVVCGAAHVAPLQRLLAQQPTTPPVVEEPDERCGVALTPTSYAALDALDGYDAGQPQPGFYHALYEDRAAGRSGTVERLLGEVVHGLRRAGRSVSAADLIAVLTATRGLAALRGHAEPWRSDLLDGCRTALVKDQFNDTHPLLDRVMLLLRGDRVGQLDPGAGVPPITVELRTELETLGLMPAPTERTERADLTDDTGLRRSRLLHTLNVLDIPGATLRHGADRDGSETWILHWSPEFEGRLITAARHGPTVREALTSCLLDQLNHAQHDPRRAVALYLQACLCGADQVVSLLGLRLEPMLAHATDLAKVGSALDTLMRLYRYDTLLRTTGRLDLAALVRTAFDRCLRLTERLHIPHDGPDIKPFVASLSIATDTVERCGDHLDLDVSGWDRALAGLVADDRQAVELRGAALGARWLTGHVPDTELGHAVDLVAAPEDLGDLMCGVLTVAREAALRRPDLLNSLDARLRDMDRRTFLLAAPGLRRAFSGFSTRERVDIASTVHHTATDIVTAQPTPAEDILPVAHLEERIWDVLTDLLGHVPGEGTRHD